MNEPHLNHPNDPQDAPDALPARFAYINPNQFSEEHDIDGRADIQLDADEAEAIAQALADETGVTVTVDLTDAEGESLEPLIVAPTLVQEMDGADEYSIEEEPHPEDPVSYWLILKNGDEIDRFDTEREAERYLDEIDPRPDNDISF